MMTNHERLWFAFKLPVLKIIGLLTGDAELLEAEKIKKSCCATSTVSESSSQ